MSRAAIAVIALILVAGGIVAAFTGAGNSTTVPQAPPVAASTQAPGPAGNSQIVADAVVVPARILALNFPSEGIVAEVLVQEGDTVEAGTPLARLDTRDLELRVEEARAILAQARANYEKQRADADTARLRTGIDIAQLRAEAARLLDSAEEARLRGRSQIAAMLEASAESLLLAAATLESGEQTGQAVEIASTAAMSNAEAQVQQAEARLRQAELALNLATLRAPVAGTVAEINLNVGASPDKTRAAIVLADLSAWQIETENLTELSVGEIRRGDPVLITFGALPGFELPGKVSQIKLIGTRQPNEIARYTVIVTPDRHEERLHWNMTASVRITTSR